MKYKIKLLTSISALLLASSVFAANDGTIDLSVTVGDANAEPTLEVTGEIVDGTGSATLETVISDGERALPDQDLGGLTFTGSNLGDTGDNCSVTFRSAHGAGSNFFLANEDADTIRYALAANRSLNGGTSGNVSVSNSSSISTPSVADAQTGVNSCSIVINSLTLSSTDNLTNKNGEYTDTLTYALVVQ